MQLFNIREVAKIVYDGLAVTARCPCHRMNLQLQGKLGESESEVGANQTDWRLKPTSRSFSAIRFRLIVTKGTASTEGRDIGLNSEMQCECTCITIDSELQLSADLETTATGKKRPGPPCTESEKKKARFAEGGESYFETSSTRAILTISGGGGTRVKRTMSINIGPGRKRVKFEIEGKGYSNESPPTIVGTPLMGRGETTEYDINASSPAATLNVAEIDNLCLLLASKLQTGEQKKELLGRIPHNGCNPTYRHLMYREPLAPRSASRVSLETILAHPAKQSLLTYLERLKIALTLSLSLLHFGSYSKSWFQERWRSRDIFFFLEPEQLRGHGTPLNPYVVPSFPTSAKIMTTDEGTSTPLVQERGLARNEQLFSLTVVLIEIGFGNTLFRIHELSKIPEKRDDDYAEYMKVQKILESGMLARQMGPVYAAVVRRCFDCDFAIEFGEGGVDLSKRDLQERFYRKVVCELERCLKRFQEL